MTRERIPGEHDLTTAVPTQPGAVGGSGFGGDLPATETDASVTEDERRQSRWEGGGRTARTSHDVDGSTDEET